MITILYQQAASKEHECDQDCPKDPLRLTKLKTAFFGTTALCPLFLENLLKNICNCKFFRCLFQI